MPLSRKRLAVAGVLTAITPAITLFWLQFFVSGATFYEGRREWGHVYKNLWIFLLLWPLSVAATLVLGLAAVGLAKRSGGLTGANLSRWAAMLSLVAGVGFWALITEGRFQLQQSPVAPAAMIFAQLLAAEFVVAGGLPLTRRRGEFGRDQPFPALDRGLFIGACVATLIGIGVLASATVVALVHGCDCG